MLWNILRRKKKEETLKEKGDRLENRVEKMFRRMGKFNIRRNVMLTDKHGNTSEIDVMYGYIFKRYIECKNFTGSVPLEYVAKFKEVLRLNGIPASRGLFITSSWYTPRALCTGIKTVDGDQLKSMERRASLLGAFKLGGIILTIASLSSIGYAYATNRDHVHKVTADTLGTAKRNCKIYYRQLDRMRSKYWHKTVQYATSTWKKIKDMLSGG